MLEPKIKAILNETSNLPVQNVLPGPNSNTDNKSLASYIDHTLLKPDATRADIDKLCDEALQYKFKVSHQTSTCSRALITERFPSPAA